MKIPAIAIMLVAFSGIASAQDMIYLSGGNKIPGKVSEISTEKIKFKNLANPTGPIYSHSLTNVQVAFNAAGDYLVFAKPIGDKEKDDFISATPKTRSYDILVDMNGNILPGNITEENETDVLVNSNGRDVKVSKSSLAFLIRKNGTHLLVAAPEESLPYLSLDKSRINELLAQGGGTVAAKAAPVVTSTPATESAPPPTVSAKTAPVAATTSTLPKRSEELNIDFALFGNKALQKTREFTDYLLTITSVKTNREAANKSINLACGLFLNENAQVEVSNTATKVKNKYKIRSYLNRLEVKSGQYDNVQVEYANISYASKFTKGADGNYYGVVSFVQKFQGFVDGNLIYGDITKRNVTVVLKHYEKAVDGESVSGWDVYLDDIGVAETKKI